MAIAATIFAILLISLFIFSILSRNKAHAKVMGELKPIRTMTHEDCVAFRNIYNKDVAVDTPVYALRGEVICFTDNPNRPNERRSLTIGMIRIDAGCELAMRTCGVDMGAYEDVSFCLAEMKPLKKELKRKDLSPEERKEIEDKIEAIAVEHTHVDMEFLFLSPDIEKSEAFVTGIDLWNINPARIKEIPKEKRESIDEPVEFAIS